VSLRHVIRFAIASMLLVRVAASSLPATPQAYPLNPQATFLEYDGNDPVSNPKIVDLQQIGVTPGSKIKLKAYGDFLWNPGQGLQGTHAVAIFSSTGQVLPQSTLHRVPGAMACDASAYVTAPTFGGLATDIREDFQLGDVVVTVPADANFLMLGADDIFWSDNVDPQADFQLTLLPDFTCGYALQLDGANDWVISTANFDLPQLTAEGWLLPTSGSAGWGGLVAWGTDSPCAWEISVGPQPGQAFEQSASFGTQVNWPTGGMHVSQKNNLLGAYGWRHWAWSYDGAVARWYVDGELQDEEVWNAPMITIGNGILGIGNNFGGGEEYLGGYFDEIRIWDHVRTQAEIRATMSSPLTGNEPGLYAYYSFDEGTGQVVHDGSGHGRDASLGNSTNPDGADPTWVPSTAPLGCPWSYGAVDGVIAGVNGTPFLHGTGTLVAGSPGSIALHYAAPSAFAMLFVSVPTAGLTPSPFKGGILWALPISLKLPLMTSPTGSVTLSFASWPSGLPGELLIAMQCAVADAAAVYGVSLSNPLLAETP
jgi:hypothetical protein